MRTLKMACCLLATALAAGAGAAPATAATAQAAQVAPADERRIVALLKAHPVVNAAVRQAQKFSGARSCRYEVLRASATPLMPDSSWTFEAEITCRQDEAAGVARVLGRLPAVEGGFDEVQVSVFFAG